MNYIYIIILLVLVAACSKDDEGILNDGSHSQGEGQTSSSVLPGKELRGVWIATVWGLPFSQAVYTALALLPFALAMHTALAAVLLAADTPLQALDNAAVLHD